MLEPMEKQIYAIQLLDMLGQRERVFVCEYFAGATYQDIAHENGISHTRARQIVLRAIEKIRKKERFKVRPEPLPVLSVQYAAPQPPENLTYIPLGGWNAPAEPEPSKPEESIFTLNVKRARERWTGQPVENPLTGELIESPDEYARVLTEAGLVLV